MGKGVLSEHEHFPSGASGQSSLEYKCAYLCIYIRKSSLDYDSIKIFIKISCILAITHGNCNQSGPVLGGVNNLALKSWNLQTNMFIWMLE